MLAIAVAVAIVLASAGTAWINRDRLGIGGGGEPESLEFASFVLPNGQVVEFAYSVPTKNDCAVAPLTVDQVMQKVETPIDYGKDQGAALATAAAIYGTYPAGEGGFNVKPYSLSESAYDAIAPAQREWLACALYGSPFQRWALETDARVQREILQRYFPLIDLALIRQDLEDLAAGKENRLSSPTLTGESLLPMVPGYMEGYSNYMRSDMDAEITVVWVRPDGTQVTYFADEAKYEAASPSPFERLLPNS
jgi:hypothetical protein